MEGLTKRDKDLKIIPGLAERWEISSRALALLPAQGRQVPRRLGLHRRRRGLLGRARAQADGSQIKSRLPADTKVVKVDDHTVDFVLPEPEPDPALRMGHLVHLLEEVGRGEGRRDAAAIGHRDLAQRLALNANGTGPFMLESHQPGVKTVFKPNPNWWGKPEHNLDEVIFTTIKSDATRVAALLSGEIDMIDPVPVQDIERIKSSAERQGADRVRSCARSSSAWTQFRDELLYSNVKGKNPFKDVRVRQAFYQAIDIEAIKSRVMRGTSAPSAILISPLLVLARGRVQAPPLRRRGREEAARRGRLSERLRGRRWTARTTATSTTRRSARRSRRCSRASASRCSCNAQPKAKYFAKAGPTAKYDSSFNLLGWTPGSFDSLERARQHHRIAATPPARAASSISAATATPRSTSSPSKILVETDTAKRDAMILEAFKIVHEEAGIIPLHQQTLAWGVSKKTKIVQRADNQILLYWVNKE